MRDASPIKLDVDDQVLPSQWDNDLKAFGGCLFHTSAWSDYRSVDGAQPLFFRWSDATTGELLALAAGTRRPPPNARRARLASYVVIESPPATLRHTIDSLSPLRGWASGPGLSPPLTELQLGSFDARGAWAESDPVRPLHRLEFLFPPCNPADVLRSMRKGTRSSIKRAERVGVEVRRAQGWQDLLAFAFLYHQTASRLEQTKGVPPDGEPPNARAAALQVLVRHGSARLYLACLDGQPVAGCLFGVWDGSAYYLQNGSSEPARACGAVHSALHHAITEFMSEGFVRVNLGGVPADARDEASIDHGLYSFKLGLGTVPVACVSGSVVLRPARARAAQAARRQRNLLRSVRRRVARAQDQSQP